MIATKPRKKSPVKAGVIKVYKDADDKAEARYQEDRATAKRQVASKASEKQKSHVEQGDQRLVGQARKNEMEKTARAKAGVSDPVKDVETARASGKYTGSVPASGTASKAMVKKYSPVKSIRKSDAKPSVKRAMIRKMG